MKTRFASLVAAAGLTLLLATASHAQSITGTQGSVSPRSPDLMQTLTAAAPSTVFSGDQTGYGRNLSCSYIGVSHTGTPANVLTIQGKIPGTTGTAATNYYDILSSASIATDIVSTISVGVNITTTANVGAQMVFPSTYRTKVVLGTGTTPTTTGYVVCTAGE